MNSKPGLLSAYSSTWVAGLGSVDAKLSNCFSVCACGTAVTLITTSARLLGLNMAPSKYFPRVVVISFASPRSSAINKKR